MSVGINDILRDLSLCNIDDGSCFASIAIADQNLEGGHGANKSAQSRSHDWKHMQLSVASGVSLLLQ